MPDRLRWQVLIVLGVVIAELGPGTLRAELPHAIAVVDDLADRVMLFDPHTGEYQGDLLTGDSENLQAPFDCEIGPTIVIGEAEYPDTILISDLRLRRVLAFDASGETFLKIHIVNVSAHGLAYGRDGRLLVAAGAAGVLAYEFGGSPVGTRVAPEFVDGPANAWDILIRPKAEEGAGDMLIADPTLDVILRFDISGNRLGVFAKLADFNFVEQLALRENGNVLAVDVFGDMVYEFLEDGSLLRTYAVRHPRGVIELFSGDLLICSEDGVQVFDGDDGTLLDTIMAGYPTTAPRCARYLRIRLPSTRGDLNGDANIDAYDIDAFILAVGVPEQFAEEYPTVDRIGAGDINQDGAVNVYDIDPFIDILAG
ncbi:MAG: dockerin type I domain-containing protein [Planctomycetota bacterium]